MDEWWLETHQVGHDDSIHDDGLGGGAKCELEPPGWLPRAHVETMSLQQEVLQLVLGRHDVLHLEGVNYVFFC